MKVFGSIDHDYYIAIAGFQFNDPGLRVRRGRMILTGCAVVFNTINCINIISSVKP
jgi:hypothetical protein